METARVAASGKSAVGNHAVAPRKRSFAKEIASQGLPKTAIDVMRVALALPIDSLNDTLSPVEANVACRGIMATVAVAKNLKAVGQAMDLVNSSDESDPLGDVDAMIEEQEEELARLKALRKQSRKG